MKALGSMTIRESVEDSIRQIRDALVQLRDDGVLVGNVVDVEIEFPRMARSNSPFKLQININTTK